MLEPQTEPTSASDSVAADADMATDAATLARETFSMSRTSIEGQADLSGNPEILRFLKERVSEREQAIPDMRCDQIMAKLHHGFEHIGRHLYGYEQAMAQTKLALLTRNHQFILGPTGTGKSYYARAVLNLFANDVRTYANQFTLETTEDALFGLIPMGRITDGTGSRNLNGSFVLSDIAFIDEAFDGRDDLLRSMLWPMSDRQYRNGNSCVDSTLHTVIACSNYSRHNQKTEAFLDRFLFQLEIAHELSPLQRQAIIRSSGSHRDIPQLPVEERLTYAELAFLPLVIDGQVASDAVELPPEVTIFLDAIITSYDARRAAEAATRGGDASPRPSVSYRNLKQLGRVVAATALLDGRRVATLEDLHSLSLAVPVVGRGNEPGLFSEAWKETMRFATRAEENVVRTLHALSGVIDSIEQGIPLRPMTIPEQIFTFLGFTTERRLSFGQLRKSVSSLRPSLPYALAYQEALLACIEHTMQASGKGQDDFVKVQE